MKSVNTFSLSVIAMVIATVVVACIDPEGEIANPFYDFSADEHEHSWGEWTPIKEATCVEEGEAIRVCADDKFHIQKIIIPKDPEAHAWEAAEDADADYIAPTCAEEGFGFRACALCGAETTGEIPALGHQFDVYQLTTPATCTEAGKGFQICVRCNRTDTTISSAPPLGHEFVIYEETTAPNCTTRKIETAQCVRAHRGCAVTDEHILDTDPDAHDWRDAYTAPTCSETGCRWEVCARCDGIQNEETVAIDPNMHEWAGDYLEPTCVAAGYRNQTCTLCRASAAPGALMPLGHEFLDEYQIETAPTCMSPGVEIAHCARRSSQGCQAARESPLDIDPNAHGWNELHEVITAATCESGGRVIVTCAYNEEHSGEQAVAALGHDYGGYQQTLVPTCTTAGMRTGACSRENCDSTNTQTVAALGHYFYGAYYETTAPTCTETGIATEYCGRDERHTQTRSVAALGHNWGAWNTGVNATCISSGSDYRTCRRNSAHSESQATPVNPNNHSYTTYTVTTASTCTMTGIETANCSYNSSHAQTTRAVAINSSAHSYISYTTTTAATCMATGTETADCSRNSSHTKATRTLAIDSNNHSYGAFTVTAYATCMATGSQIRYCSRNTAHTNTQSIAIDPNAHAYAWVYANVGVTYGNNGTRTATCTHNSAHKSNVETAYATGTPGLAYELIENNTAYRVSKGSVSSGKVWIPQYRVIETGTHPYLPVKEIAANAFKDTPINEDVFIPETVRTIGANAFQNTNLVSVEIGRVTGVTPSIGEYAFADCKYLTTFAPMGAPISNNMLQGCTALTSVWFTYNNDDFFAVRSVGHHAFAGCTSLVTVNLEKVTSFGYDRWDESGTFKGCTSLANVYLPSNLTSIKGQMFYGCTSLASITIPENVTSLGTRAFYNCTALTRIYIGRSMTNYDWWFMDMDNLASIEVAADNPNYASSTGIMYNKRNKTIVFIPPKISGDIILLDGMTSYEGSLRGDYASGNPDYNNLTNYYKNITSLTIPASVSFVSERAFEYWTNSQTINVRGKANRAATISAGWDSNWDRIYNSNTGWRNTNARITYSSSP